MVPVADQAEDFAGEWISDPDRFAELREPWNRLAAGSPFLTWDWLDCWWRGFAGGARMRVYACREGADLVGGIALGQRGGHAWAMSNQESDLYRSVARSFADHGRVLDALAAGPWSRLTLLGLAQADPVTERLERSLRSRGWLVEQALRESCPIIDTCGSVEEYRRRLSANARRQLAKSRRRLESEGRVELRVVEPLGALEPFLSEACGGVEGPLGERDGLLGAGQRLLALPVRALPGARRPALVRTAPRRLARCLLSGARPRLTPLRDEDELRRALCLLLAGPHPPGRDRRALRGA